MENADKPIGIRGFLIDTPEMGTVRAHPKGAVVIDKGRIAEMGDYDDLRRRQRPAPIEWIDRGPVVIFPGLIDCHTHLPQYPAVARGESELLPRLREHTFPVERDYTGANARAHAPPLFRQLARNGTTPPM